VNARILCRPRPGSTLNFPIPEEDALIGRDAGIAVSLPMEGVSRAHAKISWDGKSHWIEDLKSTNGTFLNGQPIAKERLRHLDVITLGKKADLLFVIRGGDAPLVKKRGIASATLTRDAPEPFSYEIGVGEITLGRSLACNVIAESVAVSQVHARIRRTPDELILEDLGSSNGTFVNSQRVSTTLLHNLDVILLGGVESYRLDIAMGEVFSSGSYSKAEIAAHRAAAGRPQFSPEWKTRYQWDSGEFAQIDEVRKRVEEERKAREAAAGAQGAKAAPAAAKKEAPKPPAPARPKPAPEAKPAAAAPSKPAAPPAPSKPAAPPPQPVEAKPPAPIAEVRLSGSGIDLVASEPGEYTLGRAADARLRVNHQTVSRRHARLVIAADRLSATVEDAGGANGTILNATTLARATALKDGDRITLGEVTLEVRLKTS
jgi:pSer/pThr/pTyr-binding forkhead associated (FHA) protein